MQNTTPDVKTAGIQYACCSLVIALFSLVPGFSLTLVFSLALGFEFKFLETQGS